MRTASAAFAEALAAPHQLATSVEVLRSGSVLQVLDVVADGTVTLDAGAAIRGRSDITIAGLAPSAASDLLAPYGNELRISRGVTFTDGTSEVVAMGVHRIEDCNVDGYGIVRVSGHDRAAIVQDARFEYPYQIAAGTNTATAIQSIIEAAITGLTFNFTATAWTTPLVTAVEGDDRWALAQQLATDIGMRVYFDGDGACVLEPISSGSAVATLAEGEGGVLLTASRTWTRSGTFNRVIATGETPAVGTPARGVATDDNPLSATYYYGPFGRVPRFYSSPFLLTDAQALSAAESILAKELGTTQQVNFGALVDPRLEPGDVARITRLATGVDENHILESLTIPLSAEQGMTGTTRQVTA